MTTERPLWDHHTQDSCSNNKQSKTNSTTLTPLTSKSRKFISHLKVKQTTSLYSIPPNCENSKFKITQNTLPSPFKYPTLSPIIHNHHLSHTEQHLPIASGDLDEDPEFEEDLYPFNEGIGKLKFKLPHSEGKILEKEGKENNGNTTPEKVSLKSCSIDEDLFDFRNYSVSEQEVSESVKDSEAESGNYGIDTIVDVKSLVSKINAPHFHEYLKIREEYTSKQPSNVKPSFLRLSWVDDLDG